MKTSKENIELFTEFLSQIFNKVKVERGSDLDGSEREVKFIVNNQHDGVNTHQKTFIIKGDGLHKLSCPHKIVAMVIDNEVFDMTDLVH